MKKSIQMYRNIEGKNYEQCTSDPSEFKKAKQQAKQKGLSYRLIKGELFVEAEKKIAPLPYSFSSMKGKRGHCFAAQVWDAKGKSVAVIEPDMGEHIATCTAEHISKASNMHDRLVSALKVLTSKYIANPGTKHEFVVCITPRSGEIPDYWKEAQAILKEIE